MTLSVLFAAAPTHHTLSPNPQPPHILLIAADDLGWNDVQWNMSGPASIPSSGNRQLTPQLASIAGESIVLTDYHVFRVCSPTRGSFMTGLLPYHHGVTGVIGGNGAVPRKFKFLPEQLKAMGDYETHMVVSKLYLLNLAPPNSCVSCSSCSSLAPSFVSA